MIGNEICWHPFSQPKQWYIANWRPKKIIIRKIKSNFVKIMEKKNERDFFIKHHF